MLHIGEFLCRKADGAEDPADTLRAFLCFPLD